MQNIIWTIAAALDALFNHVLRCEMDLHGAVMEGEKPTDAIARLKGRLLDGMRDALTHAYEAGKEAAKSTFGSTLKREKEASFGEGYEEGKRECVCELADMEAEMQRLRHDNMAAGVDADAEINDLRRKLAEAKDRFEQNRAMLLRRQNMLNTAYESCDSDRRVAEAKVQELRDRIDALEDDRDDDVDEAREEGLAQGINEVGEAVLDAVQFLKNHHGVR